MASASADGTVRVWEAATLRPVHVLRGHSQAVNAVSYNQAGDQIASAGSDQTVRIWQPSAGRDVPVFRHPGPVAELAFTTDDHLVTVCNLTAADGKTAPELTVWDAAAGRRLGSAEANGLRANGVAVSRDGRLAAVVGFDPVVRLWELAPDGGLHRRADLRGHPKYVYCAAFSPDGRQLAAANDHWRGFAQEPPSGETFPPIFWRSGTSGPGPNATPCLRTRRVNFG